MKDFLSYTHLLALALTLALTSSMSKDANAGGNNDTYGTALMGIGTTGAMITLASTDSAMALSDCAKCVTGTCNVGELKWQCASLPLSIATIIAGAAMMKSSQETADRVKKNRENANSSNDNPEPTNTNQNFNPLSTNRPDLSNPGQGNGHDWNNLRDKYCKPETANTYLCNSNGTEQMRQDLAMVEDLNRRGLLGVNNPAKVMSEIEKAKRMLDNLESGNYDAVLADGRATPRDEDIAGRGRAGLANSGGFFSGAGDSSGFGNGAHANYRGMAGLTAAGGGGGRERGNDKVGPVDAKLNPVEWNGGLDMVDSETGKSLTIWERATRRYMGTPEGKRGFTMARIEHLRKQSNPKLAKASGTPEGEKVAKKESKPIRPVQISTSQIIGR